MPVYSAARDAVKLPPPSWKIWLILAALLAGGARLVAAPISHLQVRVVTGALELTPGSVIELRIYEAGKPVRRLALTHGEAWPRDSTRIIPLSLTEPLDIRAVSRFALYYRAASPLTPPWEVVAADVDLSPGSGPPQRLLDATLSGTIAHEGELATEERDLAAMACASDADCDDHRHCNGLERCAPRAVGADARGCVKGVPVACPVNQICSESRGCIGTPAIAPN